MPLVVCATPIGNLEDVTLRVLRELGEADLVLCEDTRRTRTLLDRHGIQVKLVSYHRHNEAKRVDELLPRLEAGEKIALASDAGLPGVNDPGARLISAAIDRGLEVTVLPGASAVETALVASGLVGERYSFVGYLPRGREALDRLWEETAPRSGQLRCCKIGCPRLGGSNWAAKEISTRRFRSSRASSSKPPMELTPRKR